MWDMPKPKPHRRLPKARRHPVIHPTGLSEALLQHRVSKPRPAGAVTSGEMVEDLLAFIAKRYDGRHLDIEVAQLALSNVAHQMIMMHLRAVAGGQRKTPQPGRGFSKSAGLD